MIPLQENYTIGCSEIVGVPTIQLAMSYTQIEQEQRESLSIMAGIKISSLYSLYFKSLSSSYIQLQYDHPSIWSD